MAKGSGPNARESGTGQDTHKVCVPVPPRPLRPAGHCGTLSRPVPLSRVGRLTMGTSPFGSPIAAAPVPLARVFPEEAP